MMARYLHVDTHGYDGSYLETCDILNNQLFDALEGISNYGDFACMTKYSQHINPGVEVVGSLIPLPLVERDASTIKSKADDAPPGHGDDTVADGSGRKDWQVDFRCSNPHWPAFLDSILSDTFRKLGINRSEVRAVPSKLILSEAGSRLRLHNVSEEPNREKSGTLVISLPSRYEGAEVRLTHGKECHGFAIAALSGFDLTAVAWYSDVKDELGPVTSGHRLVMTYNLMCGGLNPPHSAAKMKKQQAILQKALNARRNKFHTDIKVMYMLRHGYSGSSLSVEMLRERDRHLVRCLKQACRETGFYLLLATVGRKKKRRINEYGVPEDALYLDHITTVDGDDVARSVHVQDCRIINCDPRWPSPRCRDSEDGSETDDNGNIPRKNLRQDSVLLIVSVEGLSDLIEAQPDSAAKLLEMVCLPTVSPRKATEGDRSRVKKFLARLTEQIGSTIKDVHFLGLLLSACKRWSPQGLYDKAVQNAITEAEVESDDDDVSSQSSVADSLHSSQPSVTDPSESSQPFMTRSTKFTISDIAKIIAEIAVASMSSYTDHEQEFKKCCGEFARNIHLDEFEEYLYEIEQNLSEELRPPFRRCASLITRHTFETNGSFTVLDLHFVWRVMQANLDDDEWITTEFLPKLGQSSERLLIFSLIERVSKNDFSALKSKQSLARRLLEATLPKLHLEIGDFEPDTRSSIKEENYFAEARYGNGHKDSALADFLNLFRSCFECGLGEQGMDLLKHSYSNLEQAITQLRREGGQRSVHRMNPWGDISKAQGQANAREVLNVVVDTLRQHMEPAPFVPPAFVQKLFLLLFNRYIQRDHPGSPPDQPTTTTWSHKPRHCAKGVSCNSCKIIQNFIIAPDRPEATFIDHRNYPRNFRKHIEDMLPKQHFSCTMTSQKYYGRFVNALKITKRSVHSVHEELKQIFADKLRMYEKGLLPFRQPVVQRILGDETYKELIMLESAQSAESDAPVSGTKRSAEESPDQPAPTRQRTGDVTNELI